MTKPEDGAALNGVALSDLLGCTPAVAAKILAARDALIAGDANEAYHQLYKIACPQCDSLEPWARIERLAAT